MGHSRIGHHAATPMLDLPGHPVLNKQALIGKCLRLPLRVDAQALLTEVAALPGATWDSTGGRVGVHRAAQAVFLRGYAPAEGNKPIEERPTLAQLPRIRELIGSIIPAPAQRCLLARLPAQARIAPHIDQAPYFHKTLRVHVPIETNEDVWMICQDEAFHMAPGEVWIINNSNVHAVCNDDPACARIHLICDFLPSPSLLELVAAADRRPGIPAASLRAGTA